MLTSYHADVWNRCTTYFDHDSFWSGTKKPTSNNQRINKVWTLACNIFLSNIINAYFTFFQDDDDDTYFLMRLLFYFVGLKYQEVMLLK